jgi:hypothetical protein
MEMRKMGIAGAVSLLAFAACLFLYNGKNVAAGSVAASPGYKVTL